MNKPDVIIIRGASCTGKSTLANLIRTNEKGVSIEIDSIRFMINGIDWVNGVDDYFNGIKISLTLIDRFIDLGYEKIFVLDTFRDDILLNYVSKLKYNYQIFTLYCDESFLIERLKKCKVDNDNLFKSIILQNQKNKAQISNFSSQVFIDTSFATPEQILEKIVQIRTAYNNG